MAKFVKKVKIISYEDDYWELEKAVNEFLSTVDWSDVTFQTSTVSKLVGGSGTIFRYAVIYSAMITYIEKEIHDEQNISD